MRLGDAALRAVLAEGSWSVQLRQGGKVIGELPVEPVAEDDGWRFDALFGPWTRSTSWTEEVLVSTGGVENIEPAVTTLPAGRAYAVSFKVSSG